MSIKKNYHSREAIAFKIVAIVKNLFTFKQETCCRIVINICKQIAQNDYFDFSGILYSFAVASA